MQSPLENRFTEQPITQDLPNFFIIGATKSGTTSMYFYLKQHPEIFMSNYKEPHFFAFEPGSKVTYLRNGKPEQARYMITDIKAYHNQFRTATSERAIGEASAMYIYLPDAIERIRDQVPDAKLIAMLRNPVERAYSAYLHFVREGQEPSPTFHDGLDAEPGRINEGWEPLYNYQAMGFYYQQLSRVLEHFPQEQLYVILYEDFQKNPLLVTQDIYRFLGVDSTFKPDLTTKYNISGVPKNKALHSIRHYLVSSNPLKTRLKHLLPGKTRAKLKSKIVAGIEARNLEKPPLLQADKERLLTAYHDDILALQKLLGRDLSHWLK